MNKGYIMLAILSLAGILILSTVIAEGGGQHDKGFHTKPGRGKGIGKKPGRGKGFYNRYRPDYHFAEKYRPSKDLPQKNEPANFGYGGLNLRYRWKNYKPVFYIAVAKTVRGTQYKGWGTSPSLAKDKAMRKCLLESLLPGSCYVVSTSKVW